MASFRANICYYLVVIGITLASEKRRARQRDILEQDVHAVLNGQRAPLHSLVGLGFNAGVCDTVSPIESFTTNNDSRMMSFTFRQRAIRRGGSRLHQWQLVYLRSVWQALV